MKRIFQIAALVLSVILLPVGGYVSAADAADADAPLLNVSVRDAENGVMKTWDEGVSVKMGGKTDVMPGPNGAKSLAFDGTDASVAHFQLDAVTSKIRTAPELSVSFSIRVNGESAGGDTGLGVKVQGKKLVLNGNGFSLAWKNEVELGKWHQIAYVYSAQGGFVRLYFDGKPDNFLTGQRLSSLNVAFDAIGMFNGNLATIQAYPRALLKNELLRAVVEKGAFNKLRDYISGLETEMRLPQVIEFMNYGKDAIGKVLRGSTASIEALQRAELAATLVIKVAENEKAYRDTPLASAPFAFAQVQAVSPVLRSPDVFAPDAVVDARLRVAASKGEYEPISFILYPYKDLQNVTFTISDFKTATGVTLSSAIVDKKVVKYWYQESWNSNRSSAGSVLVPGLLVNDEKLLKVDEKAQKNYLRVGGKYVDISSNTESFNYCKEDVEDASQLLPLNMVRGRGKQLWFTVHVPTEAVAGLYTATLTIKGDGIEAVQLPVQLRVYPFVLPEAKTNYDHSRPYLSVLAGMSDLSQYEALAGGSKAIDFFRNEMKNIKAHGICNPVIPCISTSKSFEEDLKIRKDLGFDLKNSFIAAFPDDGTLMMKLNSNLEKKLDIAGFVSEMTKAEEIFKRVAGHDSCYFYGIEPATGKLAADVRDALLKKGCKALTYSWNMDEVTLLPTLDLMYALPGRLDDFQVEKFHALQGRVLTCGAQFGGASNPDVLRRALGYGAYHKNYDGFFLPAFRGPNCWNERAYKGSYRLPILSIPTKNGQINTIMFEGLREGIDDVRYITLLRDLLDEAHAKNNLEGKYATKKGVGVFEIQDRNNMDLDLVRIELADAITLSMMNLGKDVKK